MPTGYSPRHIVAKTPANGARDNGTDTSVEACPIEQMRLMDRLPAALKAVIWSAPVRLDLRQVKWIRAKYRDAAPAYLIAAISREYPGWKVETL